jgi:uncharacterized protein YbaP (TraB family)
MVIAGCLSCSGQKAKGFETAEKFSLLWEITGNGLQKPSYLYGTIHMYDTSIFKISEEVYKAIDTCDNFALEIDFNNIDAFSIAQRMQVTNPDSTLDKLLEAEVYAEIIKIPIVQMMGEQVNTMKPFFITSYLMIENPMTMMSVDMELNQYARNHNKNIIGLETMDEQLDMVDMISLAEQAQGIVDIYNYCKKENMGFHEAGKNIFGKMQRAYKNQDFETFENLEEEFKMTSSSPVSDSAMIADRNIHMADRISDFIQQNKTLFSGVGTLHLPDYKGMRGVVTLLKEKGYTMRPILIKL